MDKDYPSQRSFISTSEITLRSVTPQKSNLCTQRPDSKISESVRNLQSTERKIYKLRPKTPLRSEFEKSKRALRDLRKEENEKSTMSSYSHYNIQNSTPSYGWVKQVEVDNSDILFSKSTPKISQVGFNKPDEIRPINKSKIKLKSCLGSAQKPRVKHCKKLSGAYGHYLRNLKTLKSQRVIRMEKSKSSIICSPTPVRFQN